MPLAGVWRATFLASAGLAAVAGLLLFAGAAETDRFFSWTIEPPATAAFLGATYWAVVVLFANAAREAGGAPGRLAALAETAAATLLLVATLIHLDKFHHDVFGYFWIAVYALAAPLLLAALAAGAVAGGRKVSEGEPGTPLPRGLRALIAAQALAFAAYGVALFADPGWATAAWPWELTPLTARAIASFLLGFAVAGAMAWKIDELGGLRGAAWTYLALGALEIAAALIHSDDFASGAGLLAFLAFWSSVAAAGVWGLRAPLNPGSRGARPAPARGRSTRPPRLRGRRADARGARSGRPPRSRCRARPRSGGSARRPGRPRRSSR
jgi:hypothetical protein